MKSGREAPRSGPRIFLTYVVASLIPILLLAGLMMWRVHTSGMQRALDQGTAQAEVIMQMAIAPALDGRPLSQGLTSVERERLWQATDLAIYAGSVTAIRLRNFAGKALFSDSDVAADTGPADPFAFKNAADGGVSAAFATAPSGSGIEVIRVLQPVIPNATGQATGVLELYLPYAPIERAIAGQQRQMQILLGGALLLLYLVLGIVSWSTTRRLRRYADEQAQMARSDLLTGLANRGWFETQAEHMLRESRESGRAGAVVLIDLDHFKAVNDSAGHQAGDHVLQVVGERLTAGLRADDLVARLGGDEFGLFLRAVDDAEGALATLRHVREDLLRPIEVGGRQLAIDASFGVALCPANGQDLATLLHRADAAMYAGKRGAERVVLWRADLARPPAPVGRV